MGIVGALLMPFGFVDLFWRLMGNGLDWMIAVALWVASLPGAVGRIAAFGVGPLLIGTAGLILLCLLKSPLRLSGAALIGAAVAYAISGDASVSADQRLHENAPPEHAGMPAMDAAA